MIVQDIRTSESWQQKREMAHERYEQIKAGGAFDMEENFIPTREDFVAVYTVIRREFRLGHDAMSSDVMLSLLNRGDRSSINYVKLKFIIRILHELKICGVEITEDDHYKFDVYFSASKTNIEKSSILKMLRSQCRNRS